MPEEVQCDVAIIGAGPAGTAAAAELASCASVVVLERSGIVMEKPCAGGVLARALRYLPAGALLHWEDGNVRRFTLAEAHQNEFERLTRRELLRTVCRKDFDSALAEAATRAGARILRGQKFAGMDLHSSGICVATDTLRLQARVVIGADGANSAVAKEAGMVRRLDMEPALVMQVVPVSMDAFRHRAIIDWGFPPGGYSWIFPKSDHLSAGAVGPSVDREALAGYARQLLALHVGSDYEVVSEEVGFVPLATSEVQRVADRIILVGDAGALVDPFTKEGISWALWSGRLAAEAVRGFLSGRNDLHAYQEMLDSELLPELDAAARIARWFYSDPSKALCWLRDKWFVWGGFCQLLSGRITHRRLSNNLSRLGQ